MRDCIRRRRGVAAKLLAPLTLLIGLAMGCGGGGSSTPSTTQTPPPQSSSCPVVSVAEKPNPTTGTPPGPAPAPLPPPDPGATGAGSVCVSTPSDGAMVISPVQVQASTTVSPIDHMRVYVDGAAVYFTFFNQLSAQLFMPNGQHTIIVVGSDEKGNDVSTSFQVNVTGQANPVQSNLQNLTNWAPCSAQFPPGDPRAGQICAAGLGTAVSTLSQNQSTPSLSGSAAKFTMGGTQAYSNELYTQYFAGGSSPTHFVYDLNFMIDQPTHPQALEFDVNQTINNSRWTFGTECNFRGDAQWDVWDGINGWQATGVPCTPFAANTWIHLVWTFERVGNQVHYVSLAVDNQVYNLNLYYSYQPYWTIQDIDLAFQMDGDYAQEPYTVWLDKVNLTVQ